MKYPDRFIRTLEEPHEDDGITYYFNSTLADVCPFLLNSRYHLSDLSLFKFGYLRRPRKLLGYNTANYVRQDPKWNIDNYVIFWDDTFNL